MKNSQTMNRALVISTADYRAILREGCKRSLATFVREAWHIVEPRAPYRHGWHIDAICEHLEAISNGEITRLLINVPPGTMKSLLTAVFWPAWEWGPRDDADLRIIATSHNKDLATRDNVKCRRLIQSDWFQSLWPLGLTSDQNVKTKFENVETGFREAMAFQSMTGGRGDRVLVDDPLSVDDAKSPTVRESVNTTFREALPTRMVDPENSAIVVIMQRLHERDVSGLILAGDFGYEKLILPMEFETNRRCKTSIGFVDPRTQEGELLFPERFSKEVVERDKKALGEYATAGQLQQRPAPREGGMFKRSWFSIVKAAPVNAKRVRRWDIAGTEKKQTSASDPDYSVGVKMSELEGHYYIEHVVRIREKAATLERTMKNTADVDGYRCKIGVPQDPGAAGKNYAAYLIKMLIGYNVRAYIESGNKEQRAEPLSAQAEAGNVSLVQGDWNEAFLDELCMFPNAAHDDQVDGASGAFDMLFTSSTYTLKGVG